MLIVHLSDLHCGKKWFSPGSLALAIEEINELKPDMVVVTGDLTENGFLKEYELAKEYLDRIKCKRVIIGTGNHDYRSTGYLLSQRYFKRPETIKHKNSIVTYLSTARPDKDGGEVGFRQLQWLKRTLDENNEKFKVVALHHHMIPIPDTGLERTTINDAGDVIRAMTQSNVDLVLCGHRHRPWCLHLDSTTILNAGTVSSEKFRGFFANSYNIIKVRKKKIDAKIKVVGGDTLDFKKILKENEPFIP